MSYLDRLRAQSSGPFVGSVGESAGFGCRSGDQSGPSVGFVGAEGGRISRSEVRDAPLTTPAYLEELRNRTESEVFRQKKPFSNTPASSQTCPLRYPTKPTKASEAADLRNSLALYIPQANPNRCHVCGEREGLESPFIPVLSAKPESPHWLHVACHAEHVRHITARVEAMLRNTDFVPEAPVGERRLSASAAK